MIYNFKYLDVLFRLHSCLWPANVSGKPECDSNWRRERLHSLSSCMMAPLLQRRLWEAGLEGIQLICPQITALEEVVIL